MRRSRRYGAAGLQFEWRAADRLYHEDRLQEAHDALVEVGDPLGNATLYRLIEAEHETRLRAVVAGPTPWLSVEVVPDEVGEEIELLFAELRGACQESAARLGVGAETEVRIAILASDTDAPWRVGRAGYFVQKIPYGKICLPARLLGDQAELAEAVRHEYAHAIGSRLAKERVPRWLDEAVAMTMGGSFDPGLARAFATGKVEWLPALSLSAAFESHDPRQVHVAYVQAALVGRYVASLLGESGLGRILRELGADDRAARWQLLLGRTPVEIALRRVVLLGETALFDEAKRWLASRPQ